MLFAEIGDSVLVAVITAAAMVVVGVLGFGAAIITLWLKLHEMSTSAVLLRDKIGIVQSDLRDVHTIVNSQKSATQEEIDGLRKLILESMESRHPVPAAGMSAVDVKKAETIEKMATDMAAKNAIPATAPPTPTLPPEPHV
jgi:hypothetical protein